MDRGLISRKSRGSFANPHWLTGTLGFDFGLDPIWAVDVRSDGQDGLGAAGGGAGDRRRARGGGGSPDLAVNGRPSSDSSAVCTRGKRVARATHLGRRRRARAGGAELAAAHGGWRRRRTRPSGAERERGKKRRRKLLTGEEGNRRSRGRRHGVDDEMAMTHEKEDTTTKRTTS